MASWLVSPTGALVQGGVLVGADGLRRPCASDACPIRAALRRLCRMARACIPESTLPPAIHNELFDAMRFCLPPGEQFLGYPITGPDCEVRPGNAVTISCGIVRPMSPTSFPRS